MRILIIGGYGVFGGRLAQLLADDARLTLLIAGRSKDKAQRFCARLPAKATLVPVALDRDGDLIAQLAPLSADIVVDATGPFQTYGTAPYRVVAAALHHNCHYLDLADGSDFVRGIERFDADAKARGRFILSGVSSFPVLTAAVVRQLAIGLDGLDTITGGIAPSPYAGVGLNVIQAIASYAGKPIALTRDGHAATGYGLTETLRATICPPGRLPLRSTRFSLVDVPDLQLLPPVWPGLRSIWMGAGPVPEILHRGLNLLAWLVRLRLLPSLTPLAPLFHRIINTVRWGDHRGGMFVAVTGTAGGQPVSRSWHLLAEGDDGPLIPSMAVAALVRRYLDGHSPVPGARAAIADLELHDYDALLVGRSITTGTRETTAATSAMSLYHVVLGSAWDDLPQQVRNMHSAQTVRASGRAAVTRGRNVVSRMIGAVFGFPAAAPDVPVAVTFTRNQQSEVWQRTFAGQSFSSTQYPGSGRFDGLVNERFGPFVFGLALVRDANRLALVVREWSAFGVRMPRRLAPTGTTYETVTDGRFLFHVEIALPLIGLLVGYEGWLVPVPE